MMVTAYACHSADDHVYAVVREAPGHYLLFIRAADNRTAPDKSDITYDGRDITAMETNGGQGKMAEVDKIFRLMVRHKRHWLAESMVDNFVATTPTAKCRFRYSYNLSP